MVTIILVAGATKICPEKNASTKIRIMEIQIFNLRYGLCITAFLCFMKIKSGKK